MGLLYLEHVCVYDSCACVRSAHTWTHAQFTRVRIYMETAVSDRSTWWIPAMVFIGHNMMLIGQSALSIAWFFHRSAFKKLLKDHASLRRCYHVNGRWLELMCVYVRLYGRLAKSISRCLRYRRPKCPKRVNFELCDPYSSKYKTDSNGASWSRTCLWGKKKETD